MNQSARVFVVVSVMTPPLFRLSASLSRDLVDDEALGVDALGMGILLNLKLWEEQSKQIHFSQTERDERRRRKLQWALYLLRDPFFTKYRRLVWE
ncbi:unnamed protein product [Brassica oleracea var. botrytis]|uniref:Peroxisomal membrane protein PEX16 n=1 Tax=Brassica napus TaxID=3708 RepID=A0A816M1J0_BRANA|nr:unnamed protein product [Brassica napus]